MARDVIRTPGITADRERVLEVLESRSIYDLVTFRNKLLRMTTPRAYYLKMLVEEELGYRLAVDA